MQKNLFPVQVKFCHFIIKKPFFKQALLDAKATNKIYCLITYCYDKFFICAVSWAGSPSFSTRSPVTRSCKEKKADNIMVKLKSHLKLNLFPFKTFLYTLCQVKIIHTFSGALSSWLRWTWFATSCSFIRFSVSSRTGTDSYFHNSSTKSLSILLQSKDNFNWSSAGTRSTARETHERKHLCHIFSPHYKPKINKYLNKKYFNFNLPGGVVKC